MRIVILYQPRSEHARIMEDYARDFVRQQGIVSKVELMSLDTREGAALASVYDIVRYPAVMVLSDTNQLLKFWQGEETPPLMNELASYARG